MRQKLRIGRIPYMNLYPIFHALDRLPGRGAYEFVEGYPSDLNRMVREGDIDISPSSSIEYLRDESAYSLIEGHSISSHGPILSIRLFTDAPIETLGCADFHATSQSETSVALLRVILREFFGKDCRVNVVPDPFDKAVSLYRAYLSIGDDALLAGYRASGPSRDPEGRTIAIVGGRERYIYDLGQLWSEHTGLPFVFALWIGNSRSAHEKAPLFERFKNDLDRARAEALGSLREIAQSPGLSMPEEELVSYWRLIDYGLGDSCLRGLGLFRDYLLGMGLLRRTPR